MLRQKCWHALSPPPLPPSQVVLFPQLAPEESVRRNAFSAFFADTLPGLSRFALQLQVVKMVKSAGSKFGFVFLVLLLRDRTCAAHCFWARGGELGAFW